jgi:hypothetical protein
LQGDLDINNRFDIPDGPDFYMKRIVGVIIATLVLCMATSTVATDLINKEVARGGPRRAEWVGQMNLTTGARRQ